MGKITNGNNKCKYCDKDNLNIDEDVLCDECQEVFGHMYYSEL